MATPNKNRNRPANAPASAPFGTPPASTTRSGGGHSHSGGSRPSSSSQQDAEARAIAGCLELLKGLNNQTARWRVIAYMGQRYNVTVPWPTPEAMETETELVSHAPQGV